jgi:HK97 family phage major capsid protein
MERLSDLTAQMRAERQKGANVGRLIQSLSAARGNALEALAFAQSRWPNANVVHEALQGMIAKAPVAAGDTSDASWASALAPASPLAAEFVELLQGLAVLPRLNVRRMPFNVKFSRANGGGTAQFVGQGKPTPVSKIDFDLLMLGYSKISAIAVITKELAENSSPSAAIAIANDVAAVVASFMDIAFLDPDRAAVVDVSPESITHGSGVASFNSAGSSAANFASDFKLLMRALATSEGVRLRDAVWIMSETLATTLCTLTNANGDNTFPDLGPAGGQIYKLPVLTTAVVHTSGSATEQTVVLLSPSLIAVADDGETAVDVAKNASLQMSDAPSSSATTNVSLWQNGLVGLRFDRYANWLRRRDGAVAILRNVNI